MKLYQLPFLKKAFLTIACIAFLFSGAFFLLLTGCVSHAPLRTAEHSPIPFLKGKRWNYQGQVAWTKNGTAQVEETNIDWQVEVLNVVTNQGIECAIIRGWITDLAWYEPGIKPSFSVFAIMTNRIYHCPAEDKVAANSLAEKILSGSKRFSTNEEAFLEWPLKNGKRWNEDERRDDDLYCCIATDEGDFNFPSVMNSTGKKHHLWQVAYRTLPEHEIIGIADGIGVTEYEFQHHGTVASTKVTLKSIDFSNQ